MSDEPEKSEKTEDPSQKKLDDAHKKGDVAKSQEVTTWFMTGGSALLFALMAPTVANGLREQLKLVLSNADTIEVGGDSFGHFMNDLSSSIMLVALVPMAFLAIFGIAGNLVQHAPVLSFDPIIPKWNRVSPKSGAKRLFSGDALVNFAKGLIKLIIVAVAIFAVVWPERDRLDTLITADIASILPDFMIYALKIFGVVVAIITVIAGADFAYQKHKWWERQKMTLKEVKDEYKQMEGDPHVKGKLRQIRAEKSRQRMMAAVPDAAVIVTNPTHYAVALKYDRSMHAPICLAKGIDGVALRIREMGKEHDVPIVENPPLARALYASVELDETVPAEHFKAVAELIGYVMRLREKSSWRK